MSIEGTIKSDNLLLNSQNCETWKNRFSWETNSDDVKNLEKHFVKGNFLKLHKVGRGILPT